MVEVDDIMIPASVLRDRGNLAPMEAMAIYLVDDPTGPELSHAEAAECLGVARKTVSNTLTRARRKQEA